MNTHSSIHDRFLSWWGNQILRFPVLVILLIVLISGLSIKLTIDDLKINNNTSELISSELPFQINNKRIETEFPQDSSVFLFVVQAPTPEQTSQIANQVKNQLATLKDNFSTAYIPTENDFFKQQALLYLELDDLEKLSTQLTDAQPFIGYLSQHYHLTGLLDIISKALNSNEQNLPMDIDPLLLAINDSIAHQLNGENYHVSWQNLLAGDKLQTDTQRVIVIAKPIQNFDEVLPAGQAMSAARKVTHQIMQNYPGSSIRITGEPALEFEEMEGVTKSSVVAGVVSLILVCSTLWIGLRSFKLLLTTFIVLILGLVLTAGFATLSVGHLNLISIAFAVLYIGLGVDYAIHLCLHYRDCRNQGMSNADSILNSLKTIGFSIFLCALTTAIGFLAFIPTDFLGVSELGIISAGGMFIGMTISLTLLPAILAKINIKAKPQAISPISYLSILELPFRFSTSIRIIAIFLAIASSFFLSKLVFDSNPINLRDPNSESVSTIQELLKSKTDTPFALISLASDLTSAQQTAEKIEQLDSVDSTIYLQNLVAQQQDDKLYIIEDLDLILGHQLSTFPNEIMLSDINQGLLSFQKELASVLTQPHPKASREILQQLHENLSTFIETKIDHSSQLETSILSLMPFTMERLKTSLTATPYQLSDIPDYITQNWLSANGLYKILILPKNDLNIAANLKQFVADVQSVDEASTGLPVADQASGIAVVKAFIQAFTGAMVTIAIILFIIFRNIKDVLLILFPLILASLLTGATNVLLDNPFNFANIISLPLLLGMGVDSCIHIMHRLKTGLSSSKQILQSSTARGVFFSAMTTLCSFSSLSFTPHRGTASMGLLLAVGIFFTLVCSLIVLPAFYGKKSQ